VASRADVPSLAPGPAEARRVLKSPALAERVRELRDAADAARERPIAGLPASGREDFLRTGDRLGFERPYFERRSSLVALGLSSWLWRERSDIAALERLIEAICLEESWSLPAHEEEIDLFACETAFALAEIAACLGGELEVAIAERVAKEVEGRVLGPFLEREGGWAWEGMRNNWCAVCAGSIGAAAIYLVEDQARLDAILSRLGPTLSRFMESFADDGTCLEGLGYWTYGVGFFSSFAELLERYSKGLEGRGHAGGGDAVRASSAARDLLSDPKFRKIAAFQSKAYLTDSISVAFADSSAHERFRPGLAAFLARRFPEAAMPDPLLAARLGDDGYGRWCLCLRDLLWRIEDDDPKAAAAPRAEAVPSERPPAWLPEAQWLICPASSPRALGFAAKGGRNDEPHNHNDLGSFQLAFGETQFIAELGSGEYTRGYFGPERYSILCNSSLGHSVPILGGRGQEAGPERRARDASCVLRGGGARLSMDIAGAYGAAGLRRLTRTFDFDGGILLVIRDEFDLDRGAPIVERFVTGLPVGSIAIAEGGSILEVEGACLALSCSIPGLVPRLAVLEHRAHDGRAVEVACLDYELSAPRGGSTLAAEFEFRILR